MSTTFNITQKDLIANKPNVAVLPWGATESHNYHLPYSTDVSEAFEVATKACEIANGNGGKTFCYPAIPFGANAQQLDQFITVSFGIKTMYAILEDVCSSLIRQGINKLVIFNFHGGNEFKPFIRDLMGKYEIFILLIDAFRMIPEEVNSIFVEPGDHAGELETSLMMYLGGNISKADAGEGKRNDYKLKALSEAGIWSPRPWSKIHPDTGSGNPVMASKEKGEKYFKLLSEKTAKILLELSETPFQELP